MPEQDLGLSSRFALYQRTVAMIRDELPALRHVLQVSRDPVPGMVTLAEAMASQPVEFDIPPADPDGMALLHFTSGTTCSGAPRTRAG